MRLDSLAWLIFFIVLRLFQKWNERTHALRFSAVCACVCFSFSVVLFYMRELHYTPSYVRSLSVLTLSVSFVSSVLFSFISFLVAQFFLRLYSIDDTHFDRKRILAQYSFLSMWCKFSFFFSLHFYAYIQCACILKVVAAATATTVDSYILFNSLTFSKQTEYNSVYSHRCFEY